MIKIKRKRIVPSMIDWGDWMKQFDHEKLNVYQASIAFVAWSTELSVSIPKSMSVYNQLDRSSTSIALNIAEGNGKYWMGPGFWRARKH